MKEILEALETLTVHGCLTTAEALERAYLSGHRKAVKELQPVELVGIPATTYGGPIGGYINASPTRGQSPVK